jgi:hypothetical protein
MGQLYPSKQEEKCYWDTSMPYIGKHNSWKMKQAKSEEGENQSAKQAKLFEQNATMRHIPTTAGITCMALGWIISSTLTGEGYRETLTHLSYQSMNEETSYQGHQKQYSWQHKPTYSPRSQHLVTRV